MEAPEEDEHLEFKEAKENFHFEKLVKYCVALANEGGGQIILGVTDKRPRRVVGTHAFSGLARTKAGLMERLPLRIEASELRHPDGRVLVVQVPRRPTGIAIQYEGAYWMRRGGELAPMSPDMLKRIFEEGVPDYSAEICPKAKFSDLDADAIKKFKAMWRRKSGNEALDHLGDEQLLRDAGLIRDDGITYAAFILLGTREGLNRFLAQAEIIFEYRADEASIPYQQRKEYRQGFLPLHDELWALINLRNEIHQFQEGFFVGDISTFNEAVVREAILNAICHRDYRLAGSIFIRQFPRKLEIVSPGGFPPGITPENIFWKQFPRNRLMAEAFARCGLVERSGQGANRMFEQCIKEGKRQPDFSGTDDYQVSLTLPGEVQDPKFLRFLEEIEKETQAPFSTEDLMVLDLVHREQPLPLQLRPHLSHLREFGAIEAYGHGKGVRYLLSRRFYEFLGKKGAYTRKRGLDRETNKVLLLKHIQESRQEGCQLRELVQVLPALSRGQIQTLLRELRAEEKIHCIGRTNAGRWYSGPAAEPVAAKHTDS